MVKLATVRFAPPRPVMLCWMIASSVALGISPAVVPHVATVFHPPLAIVMYSSVRIPISAIQLNPSFMFVSVIVSEAVELSRVYAPTFVVSFDHDPPLYLYKPSFASFGDPCNSESV